MPVANEQVLLAVQMRAAEQALIDAGIDVHALMQIAGQGAAEWVWRIAAGRSVTVLCGPGNNGGDGYVIAETLRQRGLAVQVAAPKLPATEAAQKAYAAYKGKLSGSAEAVSGHILVDCLFGTGLSRPLSTKFVRQLSALAKHHEYKIAVDLPSGIGSDSGAVFGPGIAYDLTLALGAWKRAHFLMPAMALMGELKLVDIGVSPNWGSAQHISRPQLTVPVIDAHKYRRGLLAIAVGAMPGAAVLAAQAAMRSGAGYVKLLTDHTPASVPSELVTDRSPLENALADKRINALLIGPGLGRDAAAKLRLAVALGTNLPLVLDADALVLLRTQMLASRTAPAILTPHDGEMTALMDMFEVEPDQAKPQCTLALARATGAIIVAKGPDTVVAAPDGRIGFAGKSTSWLSTAGTGDVLAGTIASRLAAGVDDFTAACEGVWLHGVAARLAGPAFTAGMLAETVQDAYAAAL